MASPSSVEGGQQTRDVTYIDDVAMAWTLAIQAPAEKVVGHKFYAGYGQERTVKDLAGMCRAVLGNVAAHRIHGLPAGRGRATGGVQQREGPAGCSATRPRPPLWRPSR